MREGSRLLILGLARNCSATLPVFFDWVGGLEADHQVTVIIGENGSTDDTRQAIVDAARSNVRIQVVDTSMMAAIPNRVDRMAAGRDLLRREASRHPSDYVVVADLDSTMRSPPAADALEEGIARLAAEPDLIAVTATSRPYYYDLLAYRSSSLDFGGLDKRIRDAQHNPLTYYWFMNRSVYEPQKHVTRLGTHRCHSAFNGLAIYRFADYVAGTYLGNRSGECEHVTLHRSLDLNSGVERVLVLDAISITTPPEHSPHGPVGFVAERLLRKLGRP